jgi:hypothetical protein
LTKLPKSGNRWKTRGFPSILHIKQFRDFSRTCSSDFFNFQKLEELEKNGKNPWKAQGSPFNFHIKQFCGFFSYCSSFWETKFLQIFQNLEVKKLTKYLDK